MIPTKLLFFLTPEDTPFVAKAKALLGPVQAAAIDVAPNYGSEVIGYCRMKKYTHCVVTSEIVLNKLLALTPYRFPHPINQKINNWAGSLLTIEGIEFLFLAPLKQLYSVPYGEFIAKKFLSKFLSPSDWLEFPAFTYALLDESTVDEALSNCSKAICLAVDIETVTFHTDIPGTLDGRTDTLIDCVCYTGLWSNGNIHTYVLPVGMAGLNRVLYFVEYMRRFNLLDVPKIFQNGLYDNFHKLCYGAPVRNYMFDTQSLMHSLYSEMPKDLAFIGAFNMRDIWYWKDLAGTDKVEYNARDGYATMCVFLSQLATLPDWAKQNYILKFPEFAPCIACNIEGEKIDQKRRLEIHHQYKQQKANALEKFRKWFGVEFNPGSWQQVKAMMEFYGVYGLATDDASLEKFAFKHPLYALFVRQIQKYRTTVKVMGSNVKVVEPGDKRKKDFTPLTSLDRTFYALNPDGTDTLRLACREGTNWVGAQIQNIPRDDPLAKEMYVPDSPDFCFFEIDYKSSEAYSTGYKSGDPALLANLNSGRDFHKNNAEMFFGIAYELVTKELRQLAKPVNHGSNYNMGAWMLLSQMGEKAMLKAKEMLKLPPHYTMLMTAEYLLSRFNDTYKVLKGPWYDSIRLSVTAQRKLVSDLGWTRYCFGKTSDKNYFNGMVAHIPQNLSVGIALEAFMDIFWKLHLPHYNVFRMHAQIHDSIKGIVHKDHMNLVAIARDLCIRPKQIKDFRGVVRTMTIPVDVKIAPPGKSWGELQEGVFKL